MSTLLERRGDILDTKIPLLTRIKFPRVWKHVPGQITIEDLQEDKFDEALNHIKHCYTQDEALCCLSKIADDIESTDNYLKLIRWWMQDTQSLVAVKEDTGKIIGVLVERVLDLYLMKTMSRVMHYHGEALKKMQTFLINMNKCVNINQLCGSEYYNQIMIWSVDPTYRNSGIGKALLQACIDQTKSFKLTILMGIFTSTQTQEMAKKKGFMSVHEQQYTWKDRSQLLFDVMGNNKSAQLMTLNLDGSDYGRNKCEEILQKYKITRLLRRNITKEKEPKDKEQNNK